MKRSVVTQTNFTPSGGFTAEQVIATVPCPLLADNPLASALVVHAVVNYTGGTNSTGVTFRVRRGSLTGAVVGQVFAPGVPTVNGYAVQVVDALSGAVPAQYVITKQEAAATANGTTNYLTATITAG
jgi:hypothetical protein